MVTHLTYSEEHYADAAACLSGIRKYYERGWELCQIRGPANGPFIVLFRMEDDQR